MRFLHLLLISFVFACVAPLLGCSSQEPKDKVKGTAPVPARAASPDDLLKSTKRKPR